MTKYGNNILQLAGTIKEVELAYTDEEREEKFYRLYLEVERLSDTVDILQLICSEKLLYDVKHEPGTYVSVKGYVRTRNYSDEEGHSHLSVFGYVADIVETDAVNPKDNNEVYLVGVICRPVRNRKTTKTNREITDMIVAVDRPYRRRDYIPCIAWSRNATLAGNREVGDEVEIKGRFQSRQFTKRETGEVFTIHEVSIVDLRVISECDDKEEDSDIIDEETQEVVEQEPSIVEVLQEEVEAEERAQKVKEESTAEEVQKDDQQE